MLPAGIAINIKKTENQQVTGGQAYTQTNTYKRKMNKNSNRLTDKQTDKYILIQKFP